MKKFCSACAALLLTPLAVSAQEACSDYQIQPGDSLREIARRAYGVPNYQMVWDANRSKIGENPNLIVSRITLRIPCRDGSLPGIVSASTAAEKAAAKAKLALAKAEADAKAAAKLLAEAEAKAEAEATARARAEAQAKAAIAEAARAKAEAAEANARRSATTQETPAPKATGLPRLTFVTGNDFAPYTDEDLPGGGIFTQLVETAVQRSDPELEYKITFINDWGAHVEDLLPNNIFDAGFPWARPNCSAPETLSESDAFRCENFYFSMPFYEVVNGFYSKLGSGYDTAYDYNQFNGARICRPESMSMAPLSAAGLKEPAVELIRAESNEDCFQALQAGSVDIVSIGSKMAWDSIEQLGLTATVVENPNLAHVDTLNVMIHKSNANAAGYITMLNAGLQIMRDSGEWYHLVSSGLNAQAVRHSN